MSVYGFQRWCIHHCWVLSSEIDKNMGCRISKKLFFRLVTFCWWHSQYEIIGFWWDFEEFCTVLWDESNFNYFNQVCKGRVFVDLLLWWMCTVAQWVSDIWNETQNHCPACLTWLWLIQWNFVLQMARPKNPKSEKYFFLFTSTYISIYFTAENSAVMTASSFKSINTHPCTFY